MIDIKITIKIHDVEIELTLDEVEELRKVLSKFTTNAPSISTFPHITEPTSPFDIKIKRWTCG